MLSAIYIGDARDDSAADAMYRRLQRYLSPMTARNESYLFHYGFCNVPVLSMSRPESFRAHNAIIR